jgi:hypothetical protein
MIPFAMQSKLIQGNQPLLLNQSGQILIVKSGSIAVFAVRLNQGIPTGIRHYLFTVTADSALIGSSAPGHSDRYYTDHSDKGSAIHPFGLLAVAIEPSEIVECSLQAATLPEIYPWIEGWIEKIGQVSGLPQSYAAETELDTYIALNSGRVWQPNRLVWVKNQQGVAAWLGNEAALFTPDCPICPVSAKLWLLAKTPVELALQDPMTLETASLMQGVEQLHHWFLIWVAQQEQQAAQTELLRLQQRQQLNQQVTQTTLQGLAALLQPRETVVSSPNALLMVTGAVGRALGVTIKPPVQSENMERVNNPLEAIARASRLRLRRVLLRDRWWQTDGGPIVAYTRDQHPVALLPMSGDRYRIYDPRQIDQAVQALNQSQSNIEENSEGNAKVNQWSYCS